MGKRRRCCFLFFYVLFPAPLWSIFEQKLPENPLPWSRAAVWVMAALLRNRLAWFCTCGSSLWFSCETQLLKNTAYCQKIRRLCGETLLSFDVNPRVVPTYMSCTNDVKRNNVALKRVFLTIIFVCSSQAMQLVAYSCRTSRKAGLSMTACENVWKRKKKKH